VGLTQGAGHRHGCGKSRWPGWGNLTDCRRRAGGHPGAVCPLLGGKALLVGADGVTGNARNPLDLSLAGIGLEQRPNRGLQVWLQNVHSCDPLCDEGVESNVLPPSLGGPTQQIQCVRSPLAGWGSLGGHKWSTLGGRRGVQLVHGQETTSTRIERRLASARLAVLEMAGHALGFMHGGRTRGRKPALMGEVEQELQQALRQAMADTIKRR